MWTKEISPYDLASNPFTLIDKDWGLVLAGSSEKNNAMTVSWGQMGIMWNKPVVNLFLRPQRYTLEFVNENPRFSFNFLQSKEFRPALNLLGKKSGRDTNKMAECGLQVGLCDDVPVFEQATLVMICKKLYCQRLEADSFLDKGIVQRYYAGGDYHYMFVAEIEKVMQK